MGEEKAEGRENGRVGERRGRKREDGGRRGRGTNKASDKIKKRARNKTNALGRTIYAHWNESSCNLRLNGSVALSGIAPWSCVVSAVVATPRVLRARVGAVRRGLGYLFGLRGGMIEVRLGRGRS